MLDVFLLRSPLFSPISPLVIPEYLYLPALTDFNVEQKLLMASTCAPRMKERKGLSRERSYMHSRCHLVWVCTCSPACRLHPGPDKTSSGRWFPQITAVQH